MSGLSASPYLQIVSAVLIILQNFFLFLQQFGIYSYLEITQGIVRICSVQFIVKSFSI